MKINIFNIVKRHVDTFRDSSDSISIEDLFIFICFPIFTGIIIYLFDIQFDEEVYGLTITVFAIFAALLLSVQVALFGIHVRTWREKEDDIEKIKQTELLQTRKILLAELNCNIAYLIIASCLFVTLTLLLSVINANNVIETSILCIFYLHFLMNLIMTIKRAFSLFQKEYETD